jgi:hypothetical protein
MEHPLKFHVKLEHFPNHQGKLLALDVYLVIIVLLGQPLKHDALIILAHQLMGVDV